MKAVAFVTDANNSKKAQWQYDKIMAAISFDLEVDIIFMKDGLEQVQKNQSWKSLDFYGIESVYYFSSDSKIIKSPIFQVKHINKNELIDLIKKAAVFI
jgi:sulfur relay (sulfurtransferase) DsrF/TusC family protein